MTIRAITLKWWLRGRWWRLTNRDFREAWSAGTAGSSKCPECVEGTTLDVLDGEPIVEICSCCHGSGTRGDA